MFFRQEDEDTLPGWLWFFLVLPIVLIILLLYRQKRLPELLQRFRSLGQSLPTPFAPAPRYTEPDSIPIEIRSEEISVTEIETDEEDTAIARATAAQEIPAEQVQTEPSEQNGQDDIEIIEGIGPRIAGLLREAGIVTFRQLAGTPVERLHEILDNARLGRLADPATWPEQAELAAAGDWDGLKQLQNTLKAGRRPNISS